MNIENPSDIIDTIKQNRERFLRYNEIKKESLYNAIEDQKLIELLDIIPFLLNSNFPNLPGYIESESVPCGILGYTPPAKVINDVKSQFTGEYLNTRSVTKPFAQMYALIGSAGTIAYTNESDLDFWICYDEHDFDRQAVSLFRSKCRSIETWALEKYNIEIHFYLNEISRVKDNIFADDEEHMSGSSVGQLLKEEFLRSSIILNGKMPFWWVVSPDADTITYEKWLQSISGSEVSSDFIDLGNLYDINQEDFLGAALQQILKSLGSPFKSIMKLGLLERYINNFTENPFICNIIKKNILNDRLDFDATDAYLIMFDHIFDYYSSVVKDKNALEILKTSFYLKVEPKLSRFVRTKGAADMPLKAKIMLSYVNRWGWQLTRIKDLDNFHNWNIEPVSKLLNGAKKFILQGYKRIITEIEAQKVKHKFTDDELKAISRKIYSHYLVADNKIDNTLSFKTYPPEKLLKIEFVRDSQGNENWFLSKRLISSNRPIKVILHKEKNLLALSVWVSLNGLFQKDYTRLEVDQGLHNLETNFIRELIAELSTNFKIRDTELMMQNYQGAPFPIVSYLIFNPFSKYSEKIDEFYFLYHDSWGTTKFERYSLESDLPQIIVNILNGSLMTRSSFQYAFNIISSSPFKSRKEFNRLKAVMVDIFSFFTEKESSKKIYATILGNRHMIFYTKKGGDNETVDYMPCESEVRMLYNISFNYGDKTEIRIDPTLKEFNYLRKIAGNYRENAVQIYFLYDNKFCNFFVSDERGSLFYFRKRADVLFQYLTKLYIFASSVIAEIQKHNPDSHFGDDPLEIYQIKKELHQSFILMKINPEMSDKINEAKKKITPFAISVGIDAHRKISYRFSLPDGSLSEQYGRDTIHNFVPQMKSLMAANPGYTYHITGITLAIASTGNFNRYTSYYFTEKNRIEIMFESLLKRLS